MCTVAYYIALSLEDANSMNINSLFVRLPAIKNVLIVVGTFQCPHPLLRMSTSKKLLFHKNTKNAGGEFQIVR